MKNKKTTTRLQKTDLYDIAATECWLEEMSAQGLHILRWGWLCCTFQIGEPKQLRYRLDPSRPGEGAEPDAELREAYQQAGWRYVCPMGSHFFLFAADDPAVPELYTDADSMGYAMKHIVRRATVSFLAMLSYLLSCLHLFVSVRSSWNGVGLSTPLQMYADSPFPLGFFICLLCLLSFTHRFLLLFRARRTLKQGKPLSAPSRYHFSIMTGVNLALVVCTGMFLVNCAVSWHYQKAHEFFPVQELSFSVPSLEDMEQNPEFEPELFLDTYDYSFHVGSGSYVASEPTFRIPTCLYIRQSGTIQSLWWDELVEGHDHERYAPSLNIQLWETRSTYFARLIYGELAQDRNFSWAEEIQPLELDWADEALFAYSDELELLQLRLGNRVAQLRYHGVQSLKEQLAACQAMMTEPWNDAE
jgi:hypothetical protein